jgi:WD40 repeat protein
VQGAACLVLMDDELNLRFDSVGELPGNFHKTDHQRSEYLERKQGRKAGNRLSSSMHHNEIRAKTTSVRRIFFSPCGSMIACTDFYDSGFWLYNISMRDAIRRFQAEPGSPLEPLLCLCFIPEQCILTGSNELLLWDRSGAVKRTFPLREGAKSALECVANSDYIVIGDNAGGIDVWEGPKWVKHNSMKTFSKETVRGLALVPSSQLVSCQGSSVVLWNLSSRETIRIFSHSSGEVNTIAVSLDGRYILSGASDGKIQLWNKSGLCLNEFDEPSEVVAVAFVDRPGATPLCIASISRDKVVRLRTRLLEDEVEEAVLAKEGSSLTALAVHGKLLVTGEANSSCIGLWDLGQ